jgi:hypothetical protein
MSSDKGGKTMIVKCMKCSKYTKIKGLRHFRQWFSVSHGLCDSCFDKFMGSIVLKNNYKIFWYIVNRLKIVGKGGQFK